MSPDFMRLLIVAGVHGGKRLPTRRSECAGVTPGHDRLPASIGMLMPQGHRGDPPTADIGARFFQVDNNDLTRNSHNRPWP